MPNLVDIDPFGPRQLRALASERFSNLVLAEIGRARGRIAALERDHPSVARNELVGKLITAKKRLASTAGAITGMFGLASVPLDAVLVVYLQLALAVELAVMHGVNLKSQRAHDELIDLLAWANGTDTLVRAGPRVLGKVAVSLLRRGGLFRLGRAVPVVAAPVSAWLNLRAIERAGHAAARHYGREKRLLRDSEDGPG